MDVNAKSDEGWTALHEAAFEGRKEIVELLISNGAYVNARGESGRTPLDLATQSKRNLETADLLRIHGGQGGYEIESHRIRMKQLLITTIARRYE